ncbi:uncharacterized protein LOC126740511 [Anthonomus grandis grandis]|uniref:uncharacterized protein LOC126740511 n=1 Tax=Anthonomus grandis grandis TaxID=2921223 RepID=UPI0021666699|nr:uncharacterized protein LOC126740511 [Anthonomus grandis grandis]
MKSGAGSEDIYVPSVKWFKDMDTFLRNVEDNKRPTQDNFNIQREEEVNEQKRENEEEIMAARNETSQEVSQKKSRTTSKLRQVTAVVNDLKKISETMTHEPANEHEYIAFGRSVAAQLMTLTPLSAIQAQERIQSVLTSFKLQDLQAQSNQYDTYADTSSAHASSSIYTPLQSPTYSDMHSSHSDGSTNITRAESVADDIVRSQIIAKAFSNI